MIENAFPSKPFLDIGGAETNEELLERVKALTSARGDFPRTFANPFPDSWKQPLTSS